MATAKSKAAVKSTAPKGELVDVHIPRGAANDDPNYFVSVNGYSYLLPRGKTSKVPAPVAFEIHRAFAAQEALDAKTEEMLQANQ